jgi:flagellar biosynthesis anti-sigma factor FlgM
MNVRNLQPITPAGADAVTRSQAETGAAPSRGRSEASGGADQASLSSASALISQAIGLPDVDMQKVTAVQNALARGAYQVSSSDVAASMMDSLTR